MFDPQMDILCTERVAALLPNLADYVARWAGTQPTAPALIEYDTGETIPWKQFNTSVDAFAAKLLSAGIRKGDVVASSLPLLKEHVFLMFACHRIGAVMAPLDLRLKATEVQYCMNKMAPKAWFFLGKTPVADFRPIVAEVLAGTPSLMVKVQFQKEEDPSLIVPGATWVKDWVKGIKWTFIKSKLTGAVARARATVGTDDPALIIFTTGSTGSPKPALLSHRNILVQNVGLATAFEMRPASRMMVNLPPSHVGCVTEQLDTTIYMGATSVILHVFDPAKSLDAIQKHKVTMLGQIPALFNLEWKLPDYDSYDLSSLEFALYGGQQVSRPFLEKMKSMAPRIGTGLGLTETAGFVTYTDVNADVDDLLKGIGKDMPAFPISVRERMQADGAAGAVKAPGEVGEICFSGPQVFLGYLGDEENTRKTISTDGVVYTGDLGYYDDDGLHFAGRLKMVIKPKGYQVFPGDIENHIVKGLKPRVTAAACVGAEHEVFTEAIMAFVEVAPGQTVDAAEVHAVCKEIAAYSRPTHVEILPSGEMPLNRVAKTDYMTLKGTAKEIVARLRAEGNWDA
jgi:fatty-acyl-CoA synthase